MTDLNSDQQRAHDIIVPFTLQRKGPGVTLIGEGGTGKTYTIMRIVSRLQAEGKKVILTAPTNKAVKQLTKAAAEYGLDLKNVMFCTLHRALGLAVLPNEDRKTTIRAGESRLPLFNVMVVDEVSMVGRRATYEYLLPDLEEYGIQLIGMGDDLQLNPVREEKSPIFSEFPSVRLSIPERQKEGSQILKLTHGVRSALLEGKPFFAEGIETGVEVQEILPAKFLKEISSRFDANTDLDEYRVLAWSNKRVAEINGAIRTAIYGKNPDPYYVGERVVTGSPVPGEERGSVLLGTDEECIVHHVELNSFVECKITGRSFRTIQLTLRPIHDDAVQQVFVDIVHPEEVDVFEETVQKLLRRARSSGERSAWAKFWTFKEQFHDIRYCYCITVHRSQGSTYQSVFVDVKDILRNPNRAEKQRLLNVAFSRPRSMLWLNKTKFTA